MKKGEIYRVVWARTAVDDLNAIIRYLADENPQAAITALDTIERSAATLRRMPLRGRVVPELAAFGVVEYHELIVTPWRILYRVHDNDVFVIAVLDFRRNLEDLLLERFLR